MTIKEARDKIITRIRSIYSDSIITNDYQRQSLLTEPEGKILVLYEAGEMMVRFGNQFGLADTASLKFNVLVLVRDYLEQDLAIGIVETLKTQLHGMEIERFDDLGRLNYEADKFIEFDTEQSKWAYSISFRVAVPLRILESYS